jgi:sigma-E factor negative regulatory protein RseA
VQGTEVTELKEQISAIMDAELEGVSQSAIVDKLCQDDALKSAWERYHLISAVVKNETASALHTDLAARVAEQISREPTRIAPRAMSPGGAAKLVKAVTGLAVAASVAVMAVMLFAPGDPANVGTGNQQLVKNTPPPARDGQTRWETLPPETENVLNTYLVEHGEFSPHSGLNGLTSYARFVSYDAE